LQRWIWALGDYRPSLRLISRRHKSNSNRTRKATCKTFIRRKTYFEPSNSSLFVSPLYLRPTYTVFSPANFRVADSSPILSASRLAASHVRGRRVPVVHGTHKQTETAGVLGAHGRWMKIVLFGPIKVLCGLSWCFENFRDLSLAG
jgi:hypothetical protein